MNKVCQKIGLTIRDIRLKKGMSQEEFSQFTGVHRTYISPLENGLKNPSISTLYKILNPLDISLFEFSKRTKL